MVRIRDPQNMAAGAVFVGLGLAGLWFGRHLRIGTAQFMEVGYVPYLACYAMIGLGVLIALTALRHDGPALTSWAWKPLILLTGTSVAFGLLIERAGLIAASIAVTWIATQAAEPLPWRQTALLTAVLTLLMVILFYWGLALPLKLWPL